MRFHWTFLSFPAVLCSAFVPYTSKQQLVLKTKTYQQHKQCLFSTASPEQQSEAERLLQRARELRESATQSEYKVHLELAEKKAHQDAKTDQLIDCLFFDKGSPSLVDNLREKNLSIETLERIVDRLDEREVIAEGKEHVRLIHKDGKASFERVAIRDEDELARIQGKIEELIEGVGVLDEEFRREKMSKNQPYVSHTEDQHWGSGKRAERLTSRAHEMRREREEQFQKRLEEFYEAQRIKKDRPPPPKAKDDHGLVP